MSTLYQELCQHWRYALIAKYNSAEIQNILNYLKFYLNKSKYYTDRNLEFNAFHNLLLRLLEGEPVQYVFNNSPFLDFEIFVDQRVLIPRPETEEWVEYMIGKIASSKPIHVLEIGTGSGCISIALKKLRPNTIITAIDVSKDALEVARENAIANHCEIAFVEMNFLEQGDTFSDSFDVLVSNPPYISSLEKNLMPDSVLRFEPNMALFAPDEDPFAFYRAISVFSKNHLKSGGEIFIELNEFKANEISSIVKQSQQFNNLEIFQDLYDKPRMLHAIKNGIVTEL